jgi:hypothetical protein
MTMRGVSNADRVFAYSEIGTIDLSNMTAEKTSRWAHVDSPFNGSVTQFINLNNFYAKNWTSFKGVLAGLHTHDINLAELKAPDVEDMSSMFYHTTVDGWVDGWQEVGEIGYHKSVNTSRMFNGAHIREVDLTAFLNSEFCRTKVINAEYMFAANQIDNLDISGVDFSECANLRGMFADARIANIYAKGTKWPSGYSAERLVKECQYIGGVYYER